MKTLDLNGKWNFRTIGDSQWLTAHVPGSVLNDLINLEAIPDPFFRNNENDVMQYTYNDYEYEKEFIADFALLRNNKLFLICEGLDTLAEITINGHFVGKTDNMHRPYYFDVKEYVVEGVNTINIKFFSAAAFANQRYHETGLWSYKGSLPGYSYIRKAHFMFGSDWSPQLPDMGIWRNIYLKGFVVASIDEVIVEQSHFDGIVRLDIRIKLMRWLDKLNRISVKLTSPDGTAIGDFVATNDNDVTISFDIEQPILWWPNGFGTASLYNLEIVLLRDGLLLDYRGMEIGLRKIEVLTGEDNWDSKFEIRVNSVPIFIKGASIVPEDSVLARRSRPRVEKIIDSCVRANFNCIRVFGGGIYPDDYFYDLCDRRGILVWNDLPFSNSIYDIDDEMEQNIAAEVRANMKRIRHHASLALWCGNNNVELLYAKMDKELAHKLKVDYYRIFEILLPKIAKETDPNTFYWRSTPSSGGSFDDPNNETRGDVHFWDVWDELKPVLEYRNHNFRFVTDFGFQSLPFLKTIQSFTLPDDRNLFSYVMENRQKLEDGNGKMLHYLARHFKFPKDFNSLIYLTQLMQGKALKTQIDFLRHTKEHSTGAIYWQLNDSWPSISWSTLEYMCVWRASHYFVKKAYAMVTVSAHCESKQVELYYSNDSVNDADIFVDWRLATNDADIIETGKIDFVATPLSGGLIQELDFSDLIFTPEEERDYYVEYTATINGVKQGIETILFVPPKHFEFLEPHITFEVDEMVDRFTITVTSDIYAKYVEVSLSNAGCVFNDNYFDLTPNNPRLIHVRKYTLTHNLDLNSFAEQIRVRSLYDTY